MREGATLVHASKADVKKGGNGNSEDLEGQI